MVNYISKIIKHRNIILIITTIITLFFIYQLKSLNIIIDPDSVLPQTHPMIVTQNLIEKIFGNKVTVVIGLRPQDGTIFQKNVLQKVQNITNKIQNSPLSVRTNITSLTSKKTKNIEGYSEGMIVKPLIHKIPTKDSEFIELKKAIDNNPVYKNLIISNDEKTTLIIAEFKFPKNGFLEIKNFVEETVQPERDENVQIYLSGMAMYLGLLEKYSSRMIFLFPLSLFIIGLIHYEAFRTKQALILPLVTALLAVVWSAGLLGMMHEPFDVFNACTPILILAIAAGHAVQILKRYYEEYSKIKNDEPNKDAREINNMAVLNSLSKVGPTMFVACSVAALGFFSLTIFELRSIRTFGIFTGAGIISALILEMTFIPALRSLLKPPGVRELSREGSISIWDNATEWFYKISMFHRKSVFYFVGTLILILSLGGYWLKVDNSQKHDIGKNDQFILDDKKINKYMAGTNLFYAVIEGPTQDSIKRPDVLVAIDNLQNYLNKKEDIGKTISIVDFIKKMNQSMNNNNLKYFNIPTSQYLVAQYLFLYSNSGDPGDFDSYVDNDYKRALVTAFVKTDSSLVLADLVKNVKKFVADNFPKDIKILFGGGSLSTVAINEIIVHDKILNILQIITTVFLITSLVFRSFIAGFLILVPLLAAVFVNFGIMGLFGIPLEISTSLISAMAVGIGADYGIYMSFRMREELRNSKDESTAIKKAFMSAGKAALFVSSAVAGGFGVLMFSYGFMIHIWMGFLIATAMLVSSISTLTIFPSLIFTLRPKFIFEERK